MKFALTDDCVKLWLTARDTHYWADRPGAWWPCSRLADREVYAEFDETGLIDLEVDDDDGEVIPADELNAITSDFLRGVLPKSHPAWFVTVGQFEEKEAQ